MMKSLRGEIQELLKDTTSGSVALANRLLEVLEHSGIRSLTPEESTALKDFVIARPQFAVIHHLVDTLSQHNFSLEGNFVEKYKTQWDSIGKNIRLAASSALGQYKKFLLHSHSETIIQFFREMLTTSGTVEIWQTISHPGGEGELQGRRLRELGCVVHIIPDVPEAETFDNVDVFVCGADMIGEHTFINKSGTHPLALKMREHDKPTIVLADPRKVIKDQSHYDSVIRTLDPLFEEIPRFLVSKFIHGV